MIDDFNGAHRFLSNFHYANMLVDGQLYPTLEHAYQAAKSTDQHERDTIRRAQGPNTAKRLGRSVQHFDPHWNTRRVLVMWNLLVIKFSTGDQSLASMLIGTGSETLIEGNHWHDNFWGDCRCNDRPGCADRGENWLGRLLMMLRDDLTRAVS